MSILTGGACPYMNNSKIYIRNDTNHSIHFIEYTTINTTNLTGYWYQNHLYSWQNYTNPKDQPIPRDRIICTPIHNQYQWGFSLEIVVLVLIAQIIWFVGMYVMWIDAQCNSELTQTGRSMGMWRAVLDLAEALGLELGNQTCAYGERELKRKIQHLGPIRYHCTEGEDGSAHLGLSSSFDDDEAGTRMGRGKVRLRWGKTYGGRSGEKEN